MGKARSVAPGASSGKLTTTVNAARTSPRPRLLEFVRIPCLVRSRWYWFVSEFPWAETIPFLPSILIGSIGSLPMLTSVKLGKRPNFGFYVINECEGICGKDRVLSVLTTSLRSKDERGLTVEPIVEPIDVDLAVVSEP